MEGTDSGLGRARWGQEAAVLHLPFRVGRGSVIVLGSCSLGSEDTASCGLGSCAQGARSEGGRSPVLAGEVAPADPCRILPSQSLPTSLC